MSVEAMAMALHHSKATGTVKVILLGIANHEGDGGAWPSLRTLAKYANVSRDRARKAVAQLERMGEIKRDVQAGGTHDMPEWERPNRYHVTIRCPYNCDGTTQHRSRDRAVEFDPPADMTSGQIDTPAGVSDRTSKPSSQPNNKTKRESRVSNRARVTLAPIARCPVASTQTVDRPHTFATAKTGGFCTDCGEVAP